MRGSEIRQDKATGQWVICAPSRGNRPRDVPRHKHVGEKLPERGENCPFCPGNESLLPEIVLQMPGPHDPDWSTRVVPNKFPALAPGSDLVRRTEGIHVFMPGYGRHEVVIESPRHDLDISQMPAEQVEIIIETYHRRYVDLMSEHRNLMTLIFRNHGAAAGTSLVHPHSQIVVTGIVPRHLRLREDAAQRFFDEWGRCVYCDILEYERREMKRVVMANDSFIAFVPFAAEVPFETWIVPIRHEADFGSIADSEKASFSRILREMLARIHERLNNPDYNFIINTSARFRANEPQLHWYLQIRPRLTTPAGFEIGSGISINPSLPETDAALLRINE